MPETDDSSLAYQELQPDQILTSAESLGYRCDGRLLALNSYENRVYRIGQEDDAPIVAKFYRPGRWTDAAILEEHRFSADLAEQEIPVLPPLVHNDKTLHHHGEFRFAVYPYRGGRAPELDDMQLLRQLGRLVARIHRLGETQAFKERPQLDLGGPGQFWGKIAGIFARSGLHSRGTP